ncbi:inositol monophosphatase 2 isoform X2 [Folsomia candida]|uniref:inositol monophosphatase 2 isoform X2 n=1 Tax=Folsomia candida TaxID=158441 RepID=UPI00160504F9|nr:inositol monophosphatase 2 isoform X2 [Folsomia candida]
MDHDVEKYYTTCMKLVNKAAEVIETAFYKTKQVESKSCDMDLVTETDKEVEKLLIDGLHLAFPDHKFIGEESTAGGEKCILTDAPTWIIDPVDGTMNFVHSLPLIAISIGLLINKKPIIGIICNPILKQTYTAKDGQGAFLNGTKIKVSGETVLAKALIATESGTNDDPAKIEVVLKNLGALLGKCHGTRVMGSAACAMAFVASGAVDSFCHLGLHCWDLAAGQLIIEEAGGFLCDYGGGEFDLMSRRVVCASSEKLAKDIASRLTQYEMERD